jgi:hypothetical protein
MHLALDTEPPNVKPSALANKLALSGSSFEATGAGKSMTSSDSSDIGEVFEDLGSPQATMFTPLSTDRLVDPRSAAQLLPYNEPEGIKPAPDLISENPVTPAKPESLLEGYDPHTDYESTGPGTRKTLFAVSSLSDS